MLGARRGSSMAAGGSVDYDEDWGRRRGGGRGRCCSSGGGWGRGRARAVGRAEFNWLCY